MGLIFSEMISGTVGKHLIDEVGISLAQTEVFDNVLRKAVSITRVA